MDEPQFRSHSDGWTIDGVNNDSSKKTPGDSVSDIILADSGAANVTERRPRETKSNFETPFSMDGMTSDSSNITIWDSNGAPDVPMIPDLSQKQQENIDFQIAHAPMSIKSHACIHFLRQVYIQKSHSSVKDELKSIHGKIILRKLKYLFSVHCRVPVVPVATLQQLSSKLLQLPIFLELADVDLGLITKRLPEPTNPDEEDVLWTLDGLISIIKNESNRAL